MALVCGIGVNDKTRPCTLNGKHLKQYTLWKDILKRCRDSVHYSNCGISDNFKSYSYFYDWCLSSLGFNEEGYQIDKDILSDKQNKIYSENTCVFIPLVVNYSLTNRSNFRGNLPIGVVKTPTGKYSTKISRFGKLTHLGTFTTIEEAFQMYKLTKEEYMKELAALYKDKIDYRVYNHLITYKVEIGD